MYGRCQQSGQLEIHQDTLQCTEVFTFGFPKKADRSPPGNLRINFQNFILERDLRLWFIFIHVFEFHHHYIPFRSDGPRLDSANIRLSRKCHAVPERAPRLVADDHRLRLLLSKIT